METHETGTPRLNELGSAQAATIVLGLVSALAWGGGDFGGGLLSRRTALFGVVLVSQLAGAVLAFVLAIARGESAPTQADLGWSVLAGVVGGIGITALYRGLAVGRMGVVAPVTGVIAALIPVTAGIVLEGLPPPLVLVGIAAAVVAVVLVSRVRDEGGGRSGIELALVGGVAIGAFSVCAAQISDGHAFGPLVVIRGAEAILIVAAVVVTRSAWRPAGRLIPAIAVVGVLDMIGNGAFILAVQAGALAVAAVLSSLYPVTTVVLATVFLARAGHADARGRDRPGHRRDRLHRGRVDLARDASGLAARLLARRSAPQRDLVDFGRIAQDDDLPEPLAKERRRGAIERGPHGCQLAAHDGHVDGPGRASGVPCDDRLGREVEDDRDRRHCRRVGPGDQRTSRRVLDTGRVNDGQAALAQSLRQRRVEHPEGSLRRGLVRLIARDDRPEAIRGQDLVGGEMACCEGRLAGPGCADQHDQAGIVDLDLGHP